MKKIWFGILLFLSALAYSQVGIGTSSPNNSAILDLFSNNKGFLPTRLTTAQRDAINPKPAGLMIYNTDLNCMQYWNTLAWKGRCAGTVIPPSVTALNCGSATFNPSTMVEGTTYSGTMTVPYTGGNGQPYPAGTPVSSTGVTGLTATLQAGTLANGSGTLTYTVSGTPSGAGTASFAISFNGASNCTVQKTVNTAAPIPASVATLDCSGNSGLLSPSTATVGVSYTGTFTVAYTGGNGQSYPAGNIVTSSSGLSYQRRAGTLNNGSGTIIYDVSGTPTSSGTFNFTASFNGAASSCTKSLTINQPAASVATLDCSTDNGKLSPTYATAGTYYTGTFTVAYTGGNGQSYPAGNIVTSSSGLTYQRRAGTLNNGSGTIIYDVSGTPTSSGTFNFTASFNGAVSTCTKSLTVYDSVPSVGSLSCGSATFSPSTMTKGVDYSGTMTIPYSDGNGLGYSTYAIFSTGVTGLVAELKPGTLNNGSGYITFNVSGTPTGSGSTANFQINFNGASSCTVAKSVGTGTPTGPSVSSLSCGSRSFNPLTITAGTYYSGTMTIPYSGGNGQSYGSWSTTSTGVTGLTAQLQPGTLANGSGSLTFDVFGTASSSGTAYFAIDFGGISCTATKSVAGGTTPPTPTGASVTSLYCSSGTFSPSTLSQGVYYSGTLTVPYSGGNGQSYAGGSSYTTNGLTVTLQGGTLNNGSGSITYTVTGTPTNSGTYYFTAAFNGAASCNVQKTISAPPVVNPSVAVLYCGSATFSPSTLTAGTYYSGTMTVPYANGNGQSYPGGSQIYSTGVTGLTATLQAGTLINGGGTGYLTYTVTGTPSASGTANFAISFYNASPCTVQKQVDSGTVTPPQPGATCSGWWGQSYNYTTSHPPTFPMTQNIGGNSVTITMTTNTVAGNNVYFDSCGNQYPYDTFQPGEGGATTTTFRFSRPVSNIQFLWGRMGSNDASNISITTRKGGVPVGASLSLLGGCTSHFSVSGNQVMTLPYPGGPGSGIFGVVIAPTGVYYDEITITAPYQSYSSLAIGFCEGVSQ